MEEHEEEEERLGGVNLGRRRSKGGRRSKMSMRSTRCMRRKKGRKRRSIYSIELRAEHQERRAEQT